MWFGNQERLKKPRDFELARLHHLDPTGRLCATLGTFGSLTNIFCPSGHWSDLVTMIQVYSLTVLVVVWSGPVGLTQLFTFYQLFGPGQQPARCSIYTVIVICEMADSWPDVMKNLFDCRPPFQSSPAPITGC